MPRHYQRRKKTEISLRRAKVAEMYLAGKVQMDIAAELDVSQATVCADIAAIEAEWAKSAQADIGKVLARELARLDQLERFYREAWESSKKPLEVTSSEKMDSETGGGRKKSSIKREHRDGNPAFLAGISDCITKRAKMLGIAEPSESTQKTQHTPTIPTRPKLFPAEEVG